MLWCQNYFYLQVFGLSCCLKFPQQHRKRSTKASVCACVFASHCPADVFTACFRCCVCSLGLGKTQSRWAGHSVFLQRPIPSVETGDCRFNKSMCNMMVHSISLYFQTILSIHPSVFFCISSAGSWWGRSHSVYCSSHSHSHSLLTADYSNIQETVDPDSYIFGSILQELFDDILAFWIYRLADKWKKLQKKQPCHECRLYIVRPLSLCNATKTTTS